MTDLVVCPYLGLSDDPRTHFAFATIDHRCHSGPRPTKVEMNHQAVLCLGSQYATCRRYVAPSDGSVGATVGATVAGAKPVADLKVAAVKPGAERVEALIPLVAATHTDATFGPVNPTRPTVRAARKGGSHVRVVAGLAAGAIAVTLAAPWLLNQGGSPGTGLPVEPVVSPSATPVAPTPAATPSPEATESPSPTVEPTASPVDTPAPTPIIHVVVRGETLSSIARKYGVTVEAIMAANGLTDKNYIVVGQRLIIPPPAPSPAP